jgi:aldehyde dehydrogenase (NAD+)
VKGFFGDKPEQSYNYGKIINEKQFDRITSYLSNGKIVFGGRSDKQNLFIEPTLLDNVTINDPVMKDEIFGPGSSTYFI